MMADSKLVENITNKVCGGKNKLHPGLPGEQRITVTIAPGWAGSPYP